MRPHLQTPAELQRSLAAAQDQWNALRHEAYCRQMRHEQVASVLCIVGALVMTVLVGCALVKWAPTGNAGAPYTEQQWAELQASYNQEVAR